MSARTDCYVSVEKHIAEIIEVSAATLEEAEEIAYEKPEVVSILKSAYSREELEDDNDL